MAGCFGDNAEDKWKENLCLNQEDYRCFDCGGPMSEFITCLKCSDCGREKYE